MYWRHTWLPAGRSLEALLAVLAEWMHSLDARERESLEATTPTCGVSSLQAPMGCARSPEEEGCGTPWETTRRAAKWLERRAAKWLEP